MIVLFPEPEEPTNATVWPYLIDKLIFFNTIKKGF